jgi:hypothetical protein
MRRVFPDPCSAALGPFVVLLGEHRADQEDDGASRPGEDADHVGPPADLLVQPLLILWAARSLPGP